MTPNTELWNENDYELFLLTHCAFADTEMQEEEIDFLEELGSLQRLRRITKEYANATEPEREVVIGEYKVKYLTSPSSIDNALLKIKRFFKADHKFTELEYRFYKALKTKLQN
jgi:hypothetical protein